MSAQQQGFDDDGRGPGAPGAPDQDGDGTGSDVRRDRTQDIFVERRPWGRFQQFATNEPVTVKIITVEPGHRLSLQRHGHRAEMWHVLDGPVDVTVGERRWSVAAGEDVWVPGGAVHRLGNSGDRTARLLEVAFGDFDEADIERLEDDYTRR
ncbi:phosphomannose isomerase type II C-terminal cupin domain [Ornithinimicrobium sp. W1665]|uniref:phosphomannose isomerase type II C-terminal cupin domain n=1 Tax=Ornithinimicrobium sp. W1665 TaxID=3416666 RepID=UPI003CF191E2